MVKVGKIKPSIHLTDLHEKHQLWTQILNTTGSLSGVHDVISFIASFFFFLSCILTRKQTFLKTTMTAFMIKMLVHIIPSKSICSIMLVKGLLKLFFLILSPWWLSLQNATLQTATNGQTPVSTTNNTVQLKCNYCRGTFSLKPETLEWEVGYHLMSFLSQVMLHSHLKKDCNYDKSTWSWTMCQ